MAPLPNPTPPTDRADWPRVRLDVRAGSGRAVSYEVGGDEFLIGGAAGCDLRLPVANVAVLCQISRQRDGVRVRRLAPAPPVLLNGRPIPAHAPTAVAHDDRLTVAGIEITVSVHTTTYVSPRLVPFPPDEVAAPAEPPRPAADADLIRRQRDLDRQTEELEADRVLWYRRRQEMEREAEEFQTRTTAREQELSRVRDDLAGLRERLAREYQERRDQLAREQNELRAATATLHEERTAFAAEQARRRTDFDEDLRRTRETAAADHAGRAREIETEALGHYRAKLEEVDRFQESLRAAAATLAERREQFDAELDARRAAADADAADRMARADGEIARRRAVLDAEVAAHQPRAADLAGQQARLAAAFQNLARQRDAFAADQDILAKARETFEAERAAEADRLGTLEAMLAARDADLTRRESERHADRAAFDADRRELNDDLLRLDRHRAEAEERDRLLDARTRDADDRLDRLRRDAAEWEETVTLAAAEQDRLRDEADRLDRHRTELDSQTAKLAERAAQLEAQQGVLAVLRAKLDRAREEAEREATALAAARAREDESQAELRARIRDAEYLRAELGTVQEDTAQERQRLAERDSLLAVGLEEIRAQKETLAAEDARLRQLETDLDARSAEFAEQAGALKGRMAQALDLQARLEADRVAVREREAALAQAEEARAALQDQLRRRAEELAARSKALDDAARVLAAGRDDFDHLRATSDAGRTAAAENVAALQREVEARAADVERQAQTCAAREEALGRQVSRLKDVGQAVAAERKALAEARAKWEADARAARDELDSFRARAAADVEVLRAQAPELEEQAAAALDRLTAAKDTLRGHLAGLDDFARQSREDLDAVRALVRTEAERLRGQEESLDRARADHRLAVAAFRQQLVEWQSKVGEMKQGLARGESRLDAKQAAVEQAARRVDATTHHLAEQAEQIRRDRDDIVQKRTEVELHLADMREWYRRKLRELAVANAERGARGAESDPPPELSRLRLADTGDAAPESEPSDSAFRIPHSASVQELDPGDRQLGELLRSLDLVDADTLAALWAEAGRQRRTLRQVLLASGAVTLYQLALIEAGNLDGLVLGRFRVIDRLRATPREALYRVLDPTRLDARGGGVFLLRHLAEAEMHDAVHPDEFRQRSAAARDAAHPNLAAVVEVLDIAGRPAVLLEWPTGLFSADWPAQAAHPGCWVRLATMAAEGIDAAHRAGLAHGRLTSDAFVLTAGGVLKLTGFGDPPWLGAGPIPAGEPSAAADLRAFGRVVFGWSQLAGKKKGGRAGKPFPAELVAVVRRLEADPEPPMADTVAADRPYASAAAVVADLARIARDTPFSDDAWDKLLRHVADHAPDAPAALRQSA